MIPLGFIRYLEVRVGADEILHDEALVREFLLNRADEQPQRGGHLGASARASISAKS